MHKGRLYPYQPTFWVGGVYFWPGFLPWKFALNFGVFDLGVPTDLGPAPYPVISQAGTIVSPQEAQWQWPAPWASNYDLLQLNIANVNRIGYLGALWSATAWLAGIQINQAYRTIRSPSYDPYEIGTFWYLTPDQFPVTQNGYFEFQPATYQQGGSPWP